MEILCVTKDKMKVELDFKDSKLIRKEINKIEKEFSVNYEPEESNGNVFVFKK